MKFKYILIFILFLSVSYSQLVEKIDSNALKSLVLPGWGQMSLKENTRSKNFFISEACIWLSYLGSHYANKWYKDDYMTFGSYHADINLSNINDDDLSLLIVHMSQYDNMNEYNETMDRKRSTSRYPENSIYNWDWDNTSNRNSFKSLRVNASRAKEINNFVISAFVINRIVSFIDVIYLSNKEYKIESSISPQLNNKNLIFNFSIYF